MTDERIERFRADLRRADLGGRSAELPEAAKLYHELDDAIRDLEAHLTTHHRIEFGTSDCQLAQYAKGA